jgi:uncharacterized protein YecT (DUF1311 family)
MKPTHIIAIIITTASCTAAAENTLLTNQFTLCMDKSEGVTVAMLDCIGIETQKQDARLNGAYKKLGTQLAPTRKKQLIAAQRLWIQYRDANCGFYADIDGGTMAAVSTSDCILQATASRANELEKFIQ